MKKTSVGLLALVAALSTAGAAAAQLPNVTPFSFEVRGGAAYPLAGLADDGGTTGYTAGGSVTFHALPMVGLYAGYTLSRFGADDALETSQGEGEFTDQGFDAGVRIGIPTPLLPIDPWIKGGVVYHRLDGEGFIPGSSHNFESERGFGFEVGAGLGLALGNKLSFTPGVTYVRYGTEAGALGDRDVDYLKVDVGLRLRL